LGAYFCHPGYSRKYKKETLGLGQPEEKMRSYLKNKQTKKGWKLGSSGKTPP
jgi:hypothetical protein